MLSEGTTAPTFTLPGTDGTEITTYSVADATREGPVVLSFYLFDFHPSCTDELCSLRDLDWFEFLPDTTVFAVSTDRAFSHRAFAREYELDFVLLSDSDGSVSESYDVLYDEFDGHKRVAKRSVFVLDETRTIRYAWATENPRELPDWSAVKTALDGLVAP